MYFVLNNDMMEPSQNFLYDATREIVPTKEYTMSSRTRVFIALMIIVGVAFCTFNLLQERRYSGSKFAFYVGSGSILVTNRGQESIPVEMRADGWIAAFAIASEEIGLEEMSKRQSNGGNTCHVVSFELPPGEAKIEVIRGSNVYFVSSSNQYIDAVVRPMRARHIRTFLIIAGLALLATPYYISHTLEHRWLGILQYKFPKYIRRLKQTIK